MKQNEVRIGNWVLYESTIDDHEPTQLNGSDIALMADMEDRYGGIPLTDEWLKKLGWEEKIAYAEGIGDYNWFERDKYSTSHIAEGLTGIHDVDHKPIEYVHEMQNLFFALTGKE